jgi:two-component sensor histidine kinase
MSVRVEIQKAVHEKIKGGTFKKVTYGTDHYPVLSSAEAVPGSIICNEVSGGLSNSVKFGATSSRFTIRDWRFEVLVEFNCEVDVSYFLLNELNSITFNSDEGVVVISPSGDFGVEHPPRQGAHNGTKMKIGLTANIRR